uniref:Trafficking protein particle complex subunit 5 n=1 Tax=Salmo salar TaxID=8030 RepID=B5XBX6_SALSA|nr:Trafficking protein particle complex subunit 5 [Salmo salar]
MDTRFTRGKSNILERPLTRPKTEVSVSALALLFSEMVQYCQSRVYSVSELQQRLADMGQSVGASMLDVLVLREKNGKRETKVLNILLFVKVSVWKAMFGKEADKLEQANDGFPAKVTAHWHKGTTLMIKFDEAVIARDKALDGR